VEISYCIVEIEALGFAY